MRFWFGFLSLFSKFYSDQFLGPGCRLLDYDDTHNTAVCLQGVICLQRKVATKDHKLVYFFAGATAALSALIEKKSRRSELALYTLPRAGDSLWHILVNRNLIPNIKHAEVSLLPMIC